MATPIPSSLESYNTHIAALRLREHPMLTPQTLYLDHAGTTLASKTLLETVHASLLGTLYGNPHSGTASTSQLVVDDARVQLLHFLSADPEEFDVVFVANATAGVKLLADALREVEAGFAFAYHVESHTSVVGMREVAAWQRCLVEDAEVEAWLNDDDDDDDDEEEEGKSVRLFAFPAQSNMTGRRLPLEWARRRRKTDGECKRTYTLLDAAAYASTARLDFSNVDAAPDFTVLSLYKIFGFPDLGALVVKKDAAHLFDRVRYFGGGTVDMVVCLREQWHAKKSGPVHERLEDGTLPFHSIVALNSALTTHEELYGTLERISAHTADLARRLYEGLTSLRHGNGRDVCTIYKHSGSTYGDARTQGPSVAFNMQDGQGRWVSNVEVEKLAAIKEIHLRTGGVCNPGGIATALNLAPWEMRENFSAGHRCGGENDIVNGKPTGVVRVSLGAMSTRDDVTRFVDFIRGFFVDDATSIPSPITHNQGQRLQVESLTVYPIKSCGGFSIPTGTPWEIRPEGLAWDREWCIVHQGTGRALSQKQHPRMALLRPRLDFHAGVLRVAMVGRFDEITIPLSRNPALYSNTHDYRATQAKVCGDAIEMLSYVSPGIAEFFSKNLGVPCTLARFTEAGSRHSKPHLRSALPASDSHRPIHLSNESPILTISRSSLAELNRHIAAHSGKPVRAAAFRANIVLAEPSGQTEQPWAEDNWQRMQIGGHEGPVLDFLGGCRRCQMVCVDQQTAEKSAEPFVTLAKTRRFEGKVLFGVHTALAEPSRTAMVQVGDWVETFGGGRMTEEMES